MAIQATKPGQGKDQAKVLMSQVEARKRLDAFRAVFEKTDRILSGKGVHVAVAHPQEALTQGAPGWTDGETIYLNGELLGQDLQKGGMTSATVLAVKGVNYHELSHVLWTPRMSDDIVKRVQQKLAEDNDPMWWWSLNALEDQRIVLPLLRSHRFEVAGGEPG
jgi:hypothetical protein